MKTPLRSLAPFALIAALALGCKTESVSQYIAPRVEGRVLDARSGQPLRNVKVQRISPGDTYRESEPSKGAALLQTPPAVRSGADGRFILQSERDFAVVFKRGWYSITLSFQLPSYETLTKNYTLADSTNTPAGEPLILTGDIPLNPLSPSGLSVPPVR